MSFRKRHVDLSRVQGPAVAAVTSEQQSLRARGTRPSAVDGRLTISTGTPSLDAILAGHGGLALGSSLLIEEHGNTDYSGALLKYYAAEGVVQGQLVHVVGAGEAWARALPAVADGSLQREPGASVSQSTKGTAEHERASERMKIAWRYEHLGEFGAGAGVERSRGASRTSASSQSSKQEDDVFCHTFDLGKRLAVPEVADVKHHSLPHHSTESPFGDVFLSILKSLQSTASQGYVHRIVIPTLLSPALYSVHACEPQHLLQFVHQMRSLLWQFSSRLTMMATIPLELHSRATGLVRWIEVLADGVLELTPFPHASEASDGNPGVGATTAQEDAPQGLVTVHKLPVFHERCGGSGTPKSLFENLAFTVSRRRFTISPFRLPPADGDTDAQQQQQGGGGPAVKHMEDKLEF